MLPGFFDVLARRRPPAPANDNPAPDQPEALSTEDTALLVIDVQTEFCDPKGARGNRETDEVSARIASLVPEFRKAGFPVYAIYFDSSMARKPDQIDWFKFKPANTDILVAKCYDSAFAYSSFDKLLRQNGHRSLLACGFNLNACVGDTILDAREQGFAVSLLRDLTGNDEHNTSSPDSYLATFRKKGITITTAAAVLENVQRSAPLSPPAPAPAPAPG